MQDQEPPRIAEDPVPESWNQYRPQPRVQRTAKQDNGSQWLIAGAVMCALSLVAYVLGFVANESRNVWPGLVTGLLLIIVGELRAIRSRL